MNTTMNAADRIMLVLQNSWPVKNLSATGHRLQENPSEKLFPTPVVWSPKPIFSLAL